jgi:co-chaperonin GroES (HSP10)
MTRVVERLSQSEDQKAEMFKAVGDLSSIELLGDKVLVGIYIEPEKTKGGIILSHGTVKESVWQGTVGLVLKKSNTAFKDETETATFFHGQDVEVGDWVVFRPGDARRVQINGVDCRMVEDTLLDMVIESPSIITHR